MQSIQIDGTYTYADNIKALKIGEKIKLISNPSNRLNSEAIGAYTTTGKKIGYVPFKSNQIDIKGKYIVSKINLTQSNPILLISMDFPNTNFLNSEPAVISNIKMSNPKFIDAPPSILSDLKKFAKFLQNSGFNIEKIGICDFSDLFITICIRTPDTTNFFYTVTKSYYESNIFKYDEFFKYGLTSNCIYQPFKIHRLEKYLEMNYKSADKICSNKKLKWSNLIALNIFEGLDQINLLGPNCGMNLIQSDNLILLEEKQIPLEINKKNWLDWIKLLVKYNVEPIEFYNPNNLLPNSNIFLNLTNFTSIYNKLEPWCLGYNHKLKAYCQIDLVDSINIVEISFVNKITQKHFIELVLKLVITNKQIINVYNPLTGTIFQIEISDIIKSNFSNIISI